jgi:hypothetical protein
MRVITCGIVALVLGGALATSLPADPVSPIRKLQRFEMAVDHWEGTFGTYLGPKPGDVVTVDLDQVGKEGLITLRPAEGPGGAFPLSFLRVEKDETTGDAVEGWRRRVILKGQSPGDAHAKTILELVVQYVVARSEQRNGRTVALTGNETHAALRLHTVLTDETIREYGRATAYHARDSGFRRPAPLR